jgi:hypothetical protein
MHRYVKLQGTRLYSILEYVQLRIFRNAVTSSEPQAVPVGPLHNATAGGSLRANCPAVRVAVPDSNLGWTTGCPDVCLVVFPNISKWMLA